MQEDVFGILLECREESSRLKLLQSSFNKSIDYNSIWADVLGHLLQVFSLRHICEDIILHGLEFYELLIIQHLTVLFFMEELLWHAFYIEAVSSSLRLPEAEFCGHVVYK